MERVMAMQWVRCARRRVSVTVSCRVVILNMPITPVVTAATMPMSLSKMGTAFAT